MTLMIISVCTDYELLPSCADDDVELLPSCAVDDVELFPSCAVLSLDYMTA